MYHIRGCFNLYSSRRGFAESAGLFSCNQQLVLFILVVSWTQKIQMSLLKMGQCRIKLQRLRNFIQFKTNCRFVMTRIQLLVIRVYHTLHTSQFTSLCHTSATVTYIFWTLRSRECTVNGFLFLCVLLVTL